MTLLVAALGHGMPSETTPAVVRKVVLVVETGFDNFLTTVETVRRDMVTTVSFTRSLVYRQGGTGQGVMRPTHTATRTRLFTFLNSHG
jgi:hypothetical protein